MNHALSEEYPVTTTTSSTNRTFADILFRGAERLGWQYAEPPALRPSPDLNRRPVWVEPSPNPELYRYQARYQAAKSHVLKRSLIVGGIGLVWLMTLGHSPAWS